MTGAEAPYEGLEQGALHGGAYLASAGGRIPNPVSGALGSAAHAMDETLANEAEERRADRIAAGLNPDSTNFARLMGELTSPLTIETAQLGQAAVKGVIGNTPTWAKRGTDAATKVVGGAATGAAIAGEQPVTGGDFSGTKAKQMALGAALGGGAELAAPIIAPGVSKSADLLKSIGTELSAGQQAGGFWNKAGETLAAVPFSGMSSPRNAAQATFNGGLANEALKQAAIPEFDGLIATKVPQTYEELQAFRAARREGQPAETAFAPPVSPETAPSETPEPFLLQHTLPNGQKKYYDGTYDVLNSYRKDLRESSPGSLTALTPKADAELPVEGTITRLEAHEPGEPVLPKSQRIGDSLPAAPNPPPGIPAIQPGPGSAVSARGTSVPGAAADLPPGSEFRGNAVGDNPPIPRGETPPPGYSYPNNFPGWEYRGNLSSEAPDYMAARSGELPEEVAEETATASPKTGEIVPGKADREVVRQEGNAAYRIALNGAPGETPPTLAADLPALKDKLLGARMRGVTPDTVTEYQDFLNDQVFSRFKGAKTGAPDSTTTWASIDGPSVSNAFKQIDAKAAAVRREAGDGPVLSAALLNAKGELLDALKTQNPVAAARLAAADKLWSYYAVLRRGGVAAKDNLYGQMTPQQLNAAAAATDRSPYRVDTSEGKTRYSDIARAGIDVGIRTPPEPSPEAKLGLSAILPAAAIGAQTAWPLAAYPAMWGYSQLGGEALARAYLNRAAPWVNEAITKSAPVAANIAGAETGQPSNPKPRVSPFLQSILAQLPNYLAQPQVRSERDWQAIRAAQQQPPSR